MYARDSAAVRSASFSVPFENIWIFGEWGTAGAIADLPAPPTGD
jgi:hypothetical protein